MSAQIRARELNQTKCKHVELQRFEPGPQLSLDQPGLVAAFTRKIPLLLFYGAVLGTFYAGVYAESTFSVMFVAINLYIFLFMTNTAIGGVVGIRRIKQWRQRNWHAEHSEAEAKAAREGTQPVEHFIIIPNYKEDEGVMTETLEALADCRGAAERMRLCLAFEAREGASGVAKAERLVDRFSGRFRQLFATFHPAGLPNELPGKSSNEQWAFRECLNRARRDGLDMLRTTVTTGDADCLWHPEYFAALGVDVMKRAPAETQWLIWQPPQFLLRNFHAVPNITRALGITSTLYEIGGLGGSSAFGQHFCFSSYSMSMALCAHVGGWDADVIAEDHHMFIKCSYSSLHATLSSDQAPRVRVEPMFLPVKSFMVEGPQGSSTPRAYWTSVVERYTQARRHMQGVSEVSYAILHYLHLLRTFKLRTPFTAHWRAWQLLHTMLGAHLMPFWHFATIIVSNYLFYQHFVAQTGKVDTSSCESVASPWDGFALSDEIAKPFGGSNKWAACYLFQYSPYVNIPPAILLWIGSVSLTLDFLYCAAADRITPDATSAQHPFQTYSKSDGGRPMYKVMQSRIFTAVQLVLEMVSLAPVTCFMYAMLPEAQAVWSVAMKGNALQYITAAKPTLAAADMGAGPGPGDSVRTSDVV